MGAGGSVMTDPYSETATLPNSKLFAPVVDIFLEVEELKNKVARCDAVIINDQLSQMYIPHSVLIDTMLIHSKASLLRIARQYNALHAGANMVEELSNRLGGPYGEFLKHSVMSMSAIRLDLLSAAMSGLGCDEELLVEVICLCDQDGLKDLKFDVAMNVNKNVSKGKLIGKTKKGSQLQKFLLRALEESREEEGPADLVLARTQMRMLHDIATSKNRNANDYLDILMNCSRTQCSAIADEYMKEHNFSLKSSITAVFRGLAGRAITLWTMPILQAVVYELRYVTDDTTFRDGDDTVLTVARLLSARDKHELCSIETEYFEMTGDSLVSVLDTFAYGNIRAAMYKRMEQNYIDGGIEILMNEYVQQNGGSMYSTFIDGHSIAQMTGFLTGMKAKYAEYLTRHEKTASGAQEHISHKIVDEAHISEKAFGLQKLSSTKAFSAAERAVYKEKFNALSDFLRGQFIKHDFDRSGALNSVEFWTMINALDLGLSAKDIEEMKQRNDWDKDGHVSFEEASHELVDTIMDLMQSQDKDIFEEIERLKKSLQIEEESPNIAATIETQKSIDDESLPPKLPKYLRASFEAYDTDKSGYLDKIEFWKFMRSIFTDAFTDYDIEELQVIIVLN